MAEHTAFVLWQRKPEENYIDGKYSRGHLWQFDGGASVAASASPAIVPLPYSVEQNVDPEEAFIASLSSCHMLFVLDLAARKGLSIDEYSDQAVGTLAKNAQGKHYIDRVILRPKIRFTDNKKLTLAELEQLHHKAHELCFIANSVKTEVVTEISLAD